MTTCYQIIDFHPCPITSTLHIQNTHFVTLQWLDRVLCPPLPSPPCRGVTPETLRSSALRRSVVPEPPTSGNRPRSSATTPILSRANTPAPSSRTAIIRQPPASRRVNNDNFILPLDVDEHGHLLATVTTFPRIALKIMREWKENLPLHLLTPDNIQEHNRRPTSDVQYAQTSANGTFTLVTKAPDAADEFLLDETQWRRAIPNYLRLITHHCNRPNRLQIVHGLQQHFDRIQAMPDFYDEFLLYLRYDIQIRGLVATQNYVPSGWEPNIFEAAVRKYNTDISKGLIKKDSGSRGRSRSHSPKRSSRSRRYRSRSPSPRQGHRYYGSSSRYEQRGRNFRPHSGQESRAFCITCGKSGHLGFKCTVAKAPYLVQDKMGRWLGPDGAQLCYKWNTSSSSCSGCDREHRCTLCGQKGHNAHNCSRESS